MSNFHTKFYAVVTSGFIGIFTDWSKVKPLINGISNSVQKFPTYHEAFDFVTKNLGYEDFLRYGLDKRKLAFDRVYIKPVALSKFK